MTESVNDLSSFVCECIERKTRRLTFDGGSTGNYIVELCTKCLESFDVEFLISQEVII